MVGLAGLVLCVHCIELCQIVVDEERNRLAIEAAEERIGKPW